MKTPELIVRIPRIMKMLLVILLLCGSCSYPHLYHSPNMMSVPMFSQAGEVSLLPAASFGSINTCFEMQAALALPAHIGIGVNYMTGGKNNSGDSYEDLSKYNYFEGFGGFYTSFRNIGIFEIYAGYGSGNENHTFAYNEWDWGGGGWVQDGTAEMKFSAFFIQPDIGIRTKYIEGAFSIRLSRIEFQDIKFQNTVYRFDELTHLNNNRTSFLLEPGFTFRGGHDPVKFQIQFLLSPLLTDPQQNFEHFRFNMGFNLKFGGKKYLPGI
jgi:hypothetical protein